MCGEAYEIEGYICLKLLDVTGQERYIMSLKIRLKTEIPLWSVKIKSSYEPLFTNASYRFTFSGSWGGAVCEALKAEVFKDYCGIFSVRP